MPATSTRSTRRWRFLALVQAALILASLGVPASTFAAITSVTPNNMNQGASGSITIAGPANNFPNSGNPYSVTFSGTGVTATNVVRSNSSTLTADVTVTGAAAAGARTLTVNGAGGFTAQTSTFTVNAIKIGSTTAITSHTPDPSVAGSAISVGVSVTRASGSATPGGTVTVSDGTVTSAPCTLSGSGATATATCSLTPSTSGAKTLTATYGGDSAFNGSTGTAAHTVNKANSTTTITTDTPDPSLIGAAVSVGVSVAAASGSLTPGGTVTVSDGTVTSAPCTLAGSGGTATATCSLTPSTAGVKTLTATYGGSTAFNGSSGTTVHTVTGADGTGTIAVHWDSVGNYSYADPTVTPGMSLELIDFNFTATANMPVGSQVTIVVPAGWTPPTIGNSAGVLAINPTNPALTTPTCALPTAGTPQMAVSGSGPWTITIDVTCAAGSTFRVRWGNTLANVITAPAAGTYVFTTQSKGPGGTLTSIPAPQPTITVSKLNQAALSITAPATKTYGDAPFAPTTSGGSGTGALTFTSSTPAVCTASGSAQVTIVGAGTCTVTATKAADANYNATTSAPYSITVNKANQAALVVTGTSSPAGYGSTQTLGTSGGSGTGAVTYSTGASTACSVVGNVLTITASTGTCTVTATRAADANYNSTTSAPVSITVQKGVLTVTPDAQSRTFGQAVPTYTYTVTGFRSGENAGNAAGYVAPTCTSPYTVATPVASSPLTITCSGGSATHYTFNTAATALLTISKVDQAALSITAPATKTYGDAPFAPTTSGGSGTGALTFTSSTPAVCTASGSAQVTIVGAGTCTVTATKAADANYNATTSAPYSITVGMADPVCTITGWTGTYDGGAHGASGTCTGVMGETLAGLDLGASYTDVPGGTADWTFTDATGNYTDDAGSVDIEIGMADPVCTITGWTGTYDGGAHGASGTCTGVMGETLAGLDLGASYTDVPGGTADWTFTDATGNYTDDAGSVDIEIGMADPVCTITGWTGTYDGGAHGASGTCTGVMGETLAGLDLGASYTDVPGGTADWTFTDATGNYTDDAGSVDIEIGMAASTTTVTCPASVTYTGDPQTPCSASVTGAGGLNQVLPVVGYTGNTAVGTATAFAGFGGDANHYPSGDSTTFEITKADPVCTITGWTGTYDGGAHGASGTCTGVMGETLAGLDLGASYTDVPGGTADWTFTDATGNYTDDAGSVDIEIGMADPVCTITGWTGTYDGGAHGASGTCTGVMGETLAGLDLGASYTDVPGGTADWTFTDATGNYTDDAGSVDIEIGMAASTTTVTCPASVTYTGDPQTPCSASVTGAGGLNQVLPVVGYTGNTAVGTATAFAGFGGDANHYPSGDSTTFEITKADPVCTITGWTGTYDGGAHGASGTCTGVMGETLAGLDLGASYTDVPGGTADWTFTDATGNYTDDAGSVDIEIGMADPVCTITGWTGTYDGGAHGASGTCTGVMGETLAGLDLGASYTDVPGGTADWTFTDATGNYTDDAGSVDIEIGMADQAITFDPIPDAVYGNAVTASATATSGLPVVFSSLTPATCSVSGAAVTILAVGTCTIQAAQAGDGNWNEALAETQSFEVTQADADCTVSGWTGTYDATAHGASGSCTGVMGETLSGLVLGTLFTNVPGGTAAWTFTDGTGNYKDTSGTADIVITKADADCTVNGWSGPYDGSPHGASGSCTGVDGEDPGTLDLGASFTNVPGGTAAWTFTGNGNYRNQSGSVDIVIEKIEQAITFPSLPNITTNTKTVKLAATTDSGLPVTYTSLTPKVCTVSGTTVTIVGTGTCTIEASQQGDATHGPAEPVQQSFTVASGTTPPTNTGGLAGIVGSAMSSPLPLLPALAGVIALAMLLLLLGLRARARGDRTTMS